MVRKYLCFYGMHTHTLTDEVIEKLASFDVIVTDMGVVDRLPEIKALNPSITLLRYHDLIGIHGPETWPHPHWDEITKHEDWFLHDRYGNRLRTKRWGGWYMMDISNPEYRAASAAHYRNTLDDNPVFDGMMGDDCWTSFHDSWDMWRVPDEVLIPQPHFHEDMIRFLHEIKARIGSRLLIPNTTGDTTDDYFNICDGKLTEDFAHPVWYGGNEWLTREEVLASGRNLSDLSAGGKLYLAGSGVDDDVNVRQVQMFSLAAFLMCQNGSGACFGWAEDYKYRQWFPEMDLGVGEPLGVAREVQTDLWFRDYENVQVYVDLSSNEGYILPVEPEPEPEPEPPKPSPMPMSLLFWVLAAMAVAAAVREDEK